MKSTIYLHLRNLLTKMTETPGLGHIEKVDLREAWSHEAYDFTPWLAKHISELGDALGLQLELQSQEAPVGGIHWTCWLLS